MKSKCFKSFAQWGKEKFGEKFLETYWCEENTLNPYEISYKSVNKIIVQCQNDKRHHYIIRCADFKNGVRCGMCTGKQVPTGGSFGDIYPNALCFWSDKNKKTPFEYTKSSHSNVWWKCKNGKHEDYSRSINSSTKYDFRCPFCSNEQENSILQTHVMNYIKDTYPMYELKHEKECTLYPKNPKTKNNLPYDNEIVDLMLIIEVHGKQHYKLNGFHRLHAKRTGMTPQEQFEYEQWKDQYKKEYALSHGYEYLEIPYTAEANDKYKQLIDDKIAEINNKLKGEQTYEIN